ncbi:hypothetical protein ACWGI1_00050 [Streptomyces sp. NPDC054835]|uniref:hypothetical protein n=1 Tax=Streptomyces exfoliatus TaxID=1905 RepID=UPI0004632EC3|nr:hypothetical protein [Streptomyces exfoliatus]
MPQPTDTTAHTHRLRLRLREVASLSDSAFVLYTVERFDQLVTAAIADADGQLRPTQHTALHAPENHKRLRDALTFAEGDLHVALERMTYHQDARAPRTARLLRKVRTALHEVQREATAFGDRQRAADSGPPSNDLIVMARSWLVHAFPDHFSRLLAEALAQAGLSARPATADVFDMVEDAWRDGRLTQPRTAQVDELLAKGDVAFRGLVADDARAQDARIPALRHPLLQRRWSKALADLVELTVPAARASSESALGRLPADVYELPVADAYKVFNSRRFLAAVWQRQAEHKYRLRAYTATVRERALAAPEYDRRRRAVETAIDRLVNERMDPVSRVLTGLCPYVTDDGLIELPPQERSQLKRQLVAEARDAATSRTPQTALPPLLPARPPVAAPATR